MPTDLSMLNPQQKNAVLQSINHNVVLLAGAGSGKTATLVKRTEYLLNDLGTSPENIMLITFTNKAANEIRERISKVCPTAYKMWIGTFHRICTRIIRKFGSKLGIQNFTILDSKASKAMIGDILEKLNCEASRYLINSIAKEISSYKNDLIKPVKLLTNPDVDKKYAATYQEYQNRCWYRKSFDFDDLIIYAILLLSSFPEVSEWVHNNIKYIMLDETQDTCSSQFVLVNLLAGNNNIMCVGDISQSIYGFRNAKPEYLEYFANTHPNTLRLKLEQNYRSTRTIIEAANAVVNHNSFGTKLKMFCDNEQGDKIQLLEAPDSRMEASWIASEIATGNRSLSDYAIIYRANYQSRLIEEELTKLGIGYTIFGSQSFYSRKEVRDLIAFCKAVINPNDEDSFRRILGTVKGVGKVTIESIIQTCASYKVDFHEGLKAYVNGNSRKSAVDKRLSIISKILDTDYKRCSEVIKDVLDLTEYRTELELIQSEETEEKLELIDEFVDMLHTIEANDKDATKEEIVDNISLLSDAKGEDKGKLNAVKLMTAHASKGLEFPVVFVIGAEEGSFPHKNAVSFNAIEEERRLFYVAMTRAKEKLYITRAERRQTGKDGSFSYCKRSRFLSEIPKTLTEKAF